MMAAARSRNTLPFLLLGVLAASPAAAALPGELAQLDAPSLSSAASELVDHLGYAPIAGLAYDALLDTGYNREAMTATLTPRGLARGLGLADPTGDDPLLDRFAARITVGGPLQYAHGRHALHAHHLDNHTTSELKCTLLQRERNALGAAFDADNVGTGFGLDRYSLTLIGEHIGFIGVTANAGYRMTERLWPARRLGEARLGSGASWRPFAGRARLGAMRFGLEGGCLLRNRGRRSVWQDEARMDVGRTDGLRVSAAIRRTTRAEVPGDHPLRVVVGLAHALGGS
jgi:hypothetical protein